MSAPKHIRDRQMAEKAARAREEEIQILAEQQRIDAESEGLDADLKAEHRRELSQLLDAALADGLKIQKIPFGKSALWNSDGSPTDLAKQSYRRRFIKAGNYRRKPAKAK